MPRHRSVPRVRLPLALLTLAALATLASAPGNLARDPERAKESRLLERADISLMLIDVEVTDKDGQPMPGLVKDDFIVQLNGLRRPIYSLDDFCRAPADEATAEGGSRAASGVSPGTAAASARFVLYMDLARMSQRSRAHSIVHARDWIRETMQDQDLVQLVAYASGPGLTELTGFTSDHQVLRDGLDRLETDPRFVDTFATTRRSRVDNCIVCCGQCDGACSDCCLGCADLADEEYYHDRAALRALKWYLRGLEPLPGRKALLLFYESAGQFPGRAYGVVINHAVGDHVGLLEEIGAEATISQTVLYAAYTGDVGDPARGDAINFGANLADFTGGRHSRGGTDVSEVVRRAGRGLGCVYRIGLRKPAGAKRDLFRAAISVKGRRLPYHFRVQFLNKNQRWWRRAQGVLESPEKWNDVSVSTAVIPTRATRNGWDFDVQVALDVDSLTRFPSGGSQQSEWEVGALLQRPGTSKTWEMLGVSTARSANPSASGTYVLHRKSFLELAPGTYQLGAFVRDRAANVFGAAESVLTLPSPKRRGATGPVLMLSRRKHLDSVLPLVKQRSGPEAPRAVVREAAVPSAARVVTGEIVEFYSWICPGAKKAPAAADVLRFLVRGDDQPLFRFEELTSDDTGLCYRITDELDTSALGPGEFTYHVRYRSNPNEEPVESQLQFTLENPVPAEEGSP